MNRLRAGESGTALAWGQGFSGLWTSAAGYTVRRAALTGATVAPLVVGVIGAGLAAQGYADAGLGDDGTATSVGSVARVGYAWADGIRPGQQIGAVADS